LSTFDAILFALVILSALWRLSTAAGRLDRVHIRRDKLRVSLLLQLASRTSAVAQLSTAGALSAEANQRLSNLIERIAEASHEGQAKYFAAESDLTAALNEIFSTHSDVQAISTSTEIFSIVNDLSDSCKRVSLARRFHNDAVGAAQLLHKRKIVRYLKLAGNTRFPRPIDMDDSIPEGFETL
jgi:signal transduction histidine kinase